MNETIYAAYTLDELLRNGNYLLASRFLPL